MYAESKQPPSAEIEKQRDASETSLRCANCDIEILWPPVVVQEKIYCCSGCAGGGPCSCDYSQYRSVNIAGVIHYGTKNDRFQ